MSSLYVAGMTCSNCERRIETVLSNIEGVTYVKADFKNGVVTIESSPSPITPRQLSDMLGPLGYTVGATPKKSRKWHSLIAILIGLAVILLVIVAVRSRASIDLELLRAGTNIGYGVLFVIGLVNSLHCVAMCGGINLSLCAAYKPKREAKSAKLLPSILYNAGRLVSYTFIGGVVGGIGSVINISPNIRGVGAIIAGAFMVIMGLSILDIPLFRKLTPKMPKLFGDRLYSRLGSAAPFSVGLLNGLMPCGPLQSVQFYALGTGGVFTGALSMFAFSLGTIPLMFGLGAAGTLLSQKATHGMMKAGAVLVAALGLFMLFMGAMNASR